MYYAFQFITAATAYIEGKQRKNVLLNRSTAYKLDRTGSEKFSKVGFGFS